MRFDPAFRRLHELAREIHALRSAADVLGWDREVMMPEGGIEERSRVLELLARLEHECVTSAAYADAIASCEDRLGELAAADDLRCADVRELRRQRDRQVRLPGALVAELAGAQSRAQHAWERARAADDFVGFAPWLDRLLGLLRQKAECLGHAADGEAWDALAEEFEPGARARELATRIFEPLEQRQGALVRELVAAPHRPDDAFRRTGAAIDGQRRLCRAIAAQLGFDFARGRIDSSAHPFTSGTHPGDVRITTRYREDDVFDALYSTIHEVGHGLYEQGLDPSRPGLPTGAAASLGLHESQSRLWENHVGRSRGFWRHIFPLVRDHLGTAFAGFDADDAYRAANRVEPSLIRVDADEATYDLHVAIRFRLERELLGGALPVADLPAAWNAAYRTALGVDVPDDRDGCMQDVHWSAGLFGYFPTYTLGNLIAAQLAVTAARDLGGLDALCEAGRFPDLLAWLRDNVHRHGGRWRSVDLVARVTGQPLSIDPFVDHLERRLRPLHGC